MVISFYFFQLILILPFIQNIPLPQKENDVVLSDFIRHYEPAIYDPDIIQRQQKRLRRSTLDNTLSGNVIESLRINITASQSVFKLVLYPETDLFSPDVIFDTDDNRSVQFDPGKTYQGTLEDDPSAIVHGLLTDSGLFDGTITTPSIRYYIEPLIRYISLNSSTTLNRHYHTIVYTEDDVIKPNFKTCASENLHIKRTKRWVDPPPQSSSSTRSKSSRYLRRTMRDENQDIDTILRVEAPNKTIISITKPTLKFNNTHKNILFNSAPVRPEFEENIEIFDSIFNRNPKFSVIDSKKTTCMLYLQADHLFFEKYGTEEACIEVMTRHVQRVNAIYKNTDFNQDGKPDNITFMIKRIKVHSSSSALNNKAYRFLGNYGVEKFLEIFSEEDYDAFCLAYMFTYRDFEMGTLGLAWTGDLKNAGGVCEKNGHYRGSMKSLNTGIVTLLNYGKHVPPAVSHVTLAHEIGHNFGSPHDPEICTPGGDDGNFIMFARATSGDKKNNNKFSQCSLNSINPVLNSKARSSKGCFIEPQVSLCGNGVVEEGEECDCGWEEDCKDSCCHPQRRYPSLTAKPCTLTIASDCSPSQGPCCTNECSLKYGDKCRDDNGCRDSSFCNGRVPQCPPSINKPNKTVCNEEFVCFMGECTGSICLAYGLESCQCLPTPEDLPTKACELCCKMPGENQPCLSSFLWNTPPYDVPDMYSKPGTPCNDYNGYCDVFQKCREVDPSGPLATLRKLLLSEESINSFKKWAVEHWYYSGLMFLSFLLILVLSVRLFGKESNLKKENITIIHSSTTETVRLPDGDNDNVTVHPVVVRSKLPYKKKVRERTKKLKKDKENDSSRKISNKVIDKNKKQIKPLSKTISEEDPLGKVRNWLLNSHNIQNGLNSIRKSKSSPAGFTHINKTPIDTNVIATNNETKVQTINNAMLQSITETSSTTNENDIALNETNTSDNTPNEMEVKLQVVFKPPFKFSIKLRKPNKVDILKDKTTKISNNKIEKSSSSNKLIELDESSNNKNNKIVIIDNDNSVLDDNTIKINKNHKLINKNVPDQVKKRAALLIKAEKIRKTNYHNGNSSSNNNVRKDKTKLKKVKSNKHIQTDLARLISQESNKSTDEVNEPFYENTDIKQQLQQPMEKEERSIEKVQKLKSNKEKLQAHLENVAALHNKHEKYVRDAVAHSSTAHNLNKIDTKLVDISPMEELNDPLEQNNRSKNILEQNNEQSPKRTKEIMLQKRRSLNDENIKKKHKTKRKKQPSSSSNYNLEKRYSMSNVPDKVNCDIPFNNKSKIRHSSTGLESNNSHTRTKHSSNSNNELDCNDQINKRHSMSELPNNKNDHKRYNDKTSNDKLSNNKRYSMSDVPNYSNDNNVHIYENLLNTSAPPSSSNNSNDTLKNNHSNRSSFQHQRSNPSTHAYKTSPSHSLAHAQKNSSKQYGAYKTSPTQSLSHVQKSSPTHSLAHTSSHTQKPSPVHSLTHAPSRTFSSNDLMRFPSVENEANFRLDNLINNKYSSNEKMNK